MWRISCNQPLKVLPWRVESRYPKYGLAEFAITTSIPFIPVYDYGLDVLYGSVCCICFVLGLVGNIVSFIYFRSKKKDVPNTVYRIITINDSVLCMAILPVGICFLTDRNPGIFFGTDILCNAWVYIWNTNCRLSIFLVIVLSSARTYALLRPFASQKLTPVVCIIAIYFVLQVLQFIGFQLVTSTITTFDEQRAACSITFTIDTISNGVAMYLQVAAIFTFIVPIFVVGISCILSIRAILSTVVRGCDSASQAGIRHSRNRATVTILLFASVYAVFNIPLVISMILTIIDAHYDNIYNFYSFVTSFILIK